MFETTTPSSAWRWLSADSEPIERGADDAYYGRVRTELLDQIQAPPATVLDIGCGGGATGAELKRRFTGASVVGIESVGAAVMQARDRLDRVIHADAERLNFAAAGLGEGSFDLIIVADVLEHMYDPWHMLARLRPLLSAAGCILASIPNVRNLWLLDKIVRGNFDYREEGLLDITHIRFFTYAEMRALFADTDYVVERTHFNIDGNLPERVPLKRLAGSRSFQRLWFALRTALDHGHRRVLVTRERKGIYRIDTARLALTGLGARDLDELFSSQIALIARRSSVPGATSDSDA